MKGALAALLFVAAPWADAADGHVEGRSEYRAPRAAVAPVIDGLGELASLLGGADAEALAAALRALRAASGRGPGG